jgi:hypothetical protein
MSASSESGGRWVPTLGTPVRSGVRGRRRGTGTGVDGALVVGVLVVLTVLLAIGAAMALGLRGFDVRTPSMGQAAPVGSAVVTVPPGTTPLHAGDVITFRPDPAVATTYTHRITAVTARGITTRGDGNGADDPWLLDRGAVVGRVVAVLPGVGWVARALPEVVAGAALVWFATGFLARGEVRTALRVLGTSLSVAVAAAVLRPFVAVQMLGTADQAGGSVARVVSTGVLPVRAVVPDGGTARLVSGQSAVLAVPGGTGGHFQLAAHLDLPPAGWVLLGVVCALPVVVAAVVGRVDRVDLDGVPA